MSEGDLVVTTGGPLSGIKVVDLTTAFMGPYCTFIMAQLGADVVKIEPPSGDVVRWLTNDALSRDLSSGFINVNRGKRSVVIDLKSEQGLDALRRITVGADVFVHNLRPEVAVRLGIGYETVSHWNPAVVYCAGYGFGEGGSYAGRPAYDDIIQAVSGMAAVQGHADGVPKYVASVVADKTCGLTVLYAVLAALFDRNRNGKGQAIDVSMFETMAAYVLIEQMGGMTYEPQRGPALYARTVSPYRRPHQASDGYIAVMLYTDAHWCRFFAAIGREDLVEDPRFESASARTANIDAVYAFVGDVMTGRSVGQWLRLFESIDVPAAPVNSVDDLFWDEHLTDVGLISFAEHPYEGTIRTVRSPVQFSAGLPEIGPAPRLGEHTTEVLREAGLSMTEIEVLTDAAAQKSELGLASG